VSSDSNATAITLSSFLKDDRWPVFPRAAQCAAATSLTIIQALTELRVILPGAQALFGFLLRSGGFDHGS
jgi:uncharacterized membrane protein (DUF4010 family)